MLKTLKENYAVFTYAITITADLTLERLHLE